MFATIKPEAPLYFIFITISLLYWQTPVHEHLWLSGDAFFNGREIWRSLTSIAAHADAVHLLSNTLLYFVFGWFLYAYFGFILFPLASIGIGAAAGIITVWFYDPFMRLIGASGMVYGMVAMWLVFYMRYDTDHRPASRFMRAVGFSLIMMFPTVYNPGTSYLAHGAGFLCGIIGGLLMSPFIKPRLNMREMIKISRHMMEN